jgi:hypothetical protein
MCVWGGDWRGEGERGCSVLGGVCMLRRSEGVSMVFFWGGGQGVFGGGRGETRCL